MVYLKRKVDTFLEEWRENPDKKPLMIKGRVRLGRRSPLEDLRNCIMRVL